MATSDRAQFGILTHRLGSDLTRINYNDPVDALVGAIQYLREGQQVMLTNVTRDALKACEDTPRLLAAGRARQRARDSA